jgi:hypothetical protein
MRGRVPSDSDVQEMIDEGTSSGNWTEGTLGKGTHQGQGYTLRDGGNRMLQWHPGGGHHGPSPYWKFSSSEIGVIHEFDYGDSC